MGYRKRLWGVLLYLVLSVLREVMAGHIAYGRLHVTEYVFPDVPNPETELRQSVNNRWSCILGNLADDRLQSIIKALLAACIGK